MPHDFQLPLAALLVSVVWLVGILRFTAAADHARRMADLRDAVQALQSHRLALEQLLNSPALLPETKLILAKVSELLTNREGVQEAVRTALERLMSTADRPVPTPSALRESLPADLAETFTIMAETGLAATMLRWPATARAWRRLSVRLVPRPAGAAATVADALAEASRSVLSPSPTSLAHI